jgi:hypothetical protein
VRRAAAVDDGSNASSIIVRVAVEGVLRGIIAGEEIRSRGRIYMISAVKVRIMLVISAHQNLYLRCMERVCIEKSKLINSRGEDAVAEAKKE